MIGLLTFQETNNFGACLQALALYYRVKKLGYDVEIIDYRNTRIYKNEVASLKPHFSPKGILRWLIFQQPRQAKFNSLSKEFRNLSKFSNGRYTIENIKECDEIYDTILVGSDQVWALNVTDYDYTYYLDFTEKCRNKIAFSSSISNEELFSKDTRAQKLLNGFSQICVREEEAVKVISETIGKDVPWVCDPTMLLTANDWDNLLHPKLYSGEYVLIYFCDPKGKIYQDAVKYASKFGYEVLFCGRCFRKGIKSVMPKTMSEWVGLIKHSHALFTASYHGFLFGLYYKKQLVFYNRNQKSRMHSLCKIFRIEANDAERIDNPGTIPNINYDHVSEKLEKFRKESDEVLKSMLSLYANNSKCARQ